MPSNDRRSRLSSNFAKAQADSMGKSRGLSVNNLDPEMIFRKGAELERLDKEAANAKRRSTAWAISTSTPLPQETSSPPRIIVKDKPKDIDASSGKASLVVPKGLRGDIRPRSMTLNHPSPSKLSNDPAENPRFLNQLEELRSMIRSKQREDIRIAVTSSDERSHPAPPKLEETLEKLRLITEKYTHLTEESNRQTIELRIERNRRDELEKTVKAQEARIAELERLLASKQ